MLLKSDWGVISGNDMAFRFIGGPLVKNVIIDIKPGSTENPVNLKSGGKIPVAILSSPDFDAPNSIDSASLTFGKTGDEMSLQKCTGSEDVNQDGRLDLICHFNMQSTDLNASSTQGVLKGKTQTDSLIQGSDHIRIVN